MNKKRIIAIVLAVVLVVGVAATVITINVLNNSNKKSTIDPNTLIGDVNLNGVVNIADAGQIALGRGDVLQYNTLGFRADERH